MNNDNYNSDQNNIPQLEPIDLKELFYKIFKYWPYIVLTVFVFLVGAFVFNRYTDRIYKTDMILLIEDDQGDSFGAAAIMQNMGYSNPRLNFFNEKLIISSFSQVERTIKHLDFGTSYYSVGSFKVSEVFQPSTYNVEIDTLHPQVVGVLYNVTML
ncbi:MAG: hypothetical protein KAH10_04030, partial [Flavobacteriales bacterium]|nr:hypothetical protein [Flavobacteriales bacterium]